MFCGSLGLLLRRDCAHKRKPVFGWFFHFLNSWRTRSRRVLAQSVRPFAGFCDWLLFGILQLCSFMFLNLFFGKSRRAEFREFGRCRFRHLGWPVFPGDEGESGPLERAGRSGSVASTPHVSRKCAMRMRVRTRLMP